MTSTILAALVLHGVAPIRPRSGCEPLRPAGLLHHVHADAHLRPADWKHIVDGIHDDGGNTLCSGSPGRFAARSTR